MGFNQDKMVTIVAMTMTWALNADLGQERVSNRQLVQQKRKLGELVGAPLRA